MTNEATYYFASVLIAIPCIARSDVKERGA